MIWFQFQTGSIKSQETRLHNLLVSGFQFQTGSIKSQVSGEKRNRLKVVSIPNWFD